MSGRYFLDTNILAYCFDSTAAAKQAIANRLVCDGVERRIAAISYQVVQEFIHLALRKFQPQMKTEDVGHYISVILRPMLAVNSSMALCQRALEVAERYRFSWYDSLIVAAAIEARCEILYSEDLQHQQRIESIQIVNPFYGEV